MHALRKLSEAAKKRKNTRDAITGHDIIKRTMLLVTTSLIRKALMLRIFYKRYELNISLKQFLILVIIKFLI